MNCALCQDNFAALAERLLDPEMDQQCRAHLEACADCREAYAAVGQLRQRLAARGGAAAGVEIVDRVMRRVQRKQFKTKKETFMSTILKHRWGFGLGAAASAAAVILTGFLILPKNQARAEEAMDTLAKGAQAVAKLACIHFRGQLRTAPQDNFSYINADSPFYTIELWKQFTPELKWRIEKPQRVIVMDGQSTVMLIKTGDVGVKLPQRTTSAFDSDWLQRIANLSDTISNELDNARAQGWKLNFAEMKGTDGRLKSVITVLAKSGVPDNDYGKNTFMGTADTRRVYRFDAQTKLLESVQIYAAGAAGEVQIFDLSQIDYNQPIDPGVWKLDLPTDVSWAQLPDQLPTLPDNEKYAAMTADQAARAFFEACGREDWDEAGKFMSPVNDRLKQYLGGVQIISLGEPFTSKTYVGQFVPYEIKFADGSIKKHNLAVRKDNPASRWQVDGGI